MTVTKRRGILTALAIMAVALPLSAFAAELTAFEKAELAQLTPALRAQVEARLSSGQKVREVLETILLNKLSLLSARGKIAAVDFEKGFVVWQGENGDLKVVPFEVATLELRKS